VRKTACLLIVAVLCVVPLMPDSTEVDFAQLWRSMPEYERVLWISGAWTGLRMAHDLVAGLAEAANDDRTLTLATVFLAGLMGLDGEDPLPTFGEIIAAMDAIATSESAPTTAPTLLLLSLNRLHPAKSIGR